MQKFSLVGLSYGGFVGYSMAAQFAEAVERVVICCSGICMEEKDLIEGVFAVSDLEEAGRILVPQSPDKLRELVGYTFFRPPPVRLIPSCFLADFIDAMCGEYVEEKRDLIRAVPKDRKLSDIPKLTQPTLIIWGEHDRVFPLELGHRLKRHLGDKAHLTIVNNTGHAFNVERPKEFIKLLKAFLVDLQPPPGSPVSIQSKLQNT